MPRLIQTRSFVPLSEQMAATPQIGVYAPQVPFDPRPVPYNDGGSGQGMQQANLGDDVAKGIEDFGSNVFNSLPGADALSNVLDWGTELARTLKLVGSVIVQVITPAFWIRIMLFQIGFLAIVGGVLLFAKG